MIPIKFNHNLDISIQLKTDVLFGNLFIPDNNTKGIVLFAHGSGSSRFSTRNRHVAEHLNRAGLATLLFDLLTEDEGEIDEHTSEFRFNIPLLAKRLLDTTEWLLQQPELQHYKIGYFGSSTGAAAALIAAAHRIDDVHAVVSRGGRPDLAYESLSSVIAPTLFIVGSLDHEVIKLNQEAKDNMTSAKVKQLTIIEGATHLFEEPGKLDEVVALASDWLKKYLT